MKSRIPIIFSKQEQIAFDTEIRKCTAEAERNLSNSIDVMVLYTLHKTFGFGKKRLMKFYEAIQPEHDKLVQHYVMPDDYIWLCEQKLSKIGVDVKCWQKKFIRENDKYEQK